MTKPAQALSTALRQTVAPGVRPSFSYPPLAPRRTRGMRTEAAAPRSSAAPPQRRERRPGSRATPDIHAQERCGGSAGGRGLPECEAPGLEPAADGSALRTTDKVGELLLEQRQQRVGTLLKVGLLAADPLKGLDQRLGRHGVQILKRVAERPHDAVEALQPRQIAVVRGVVPHQMDVVGHARRGRSRRAPPSGG